MDNSRYFPWIRALLEDPPARSAFGVLLPSGGQFAALRTRRDSAMIDWRARISEMHHRFYNHPNSHVDGHGFNLLVDKITWVHSCSSILRRYRESAASCGRGSSAVTVGDSG
jgi:hypothetical protein